MTEQEQQDIEQFGIKPYLSPEEQEDVEKFGIKPYMGDESKITEQIQLKPTQYGPQPERFRPKEATTLQNIIGAGISTVPAIAGGGAGFLLGGPLGMIGGAGAGSMMGSDLRQQYEVSQGLREKTNPYLTMTEGAIGGLTAPIGGAVPGVGTGIKELLKYGARTGLEGAALNVASLPFTTKAETGEWRLPTLGEAGSTAGMGFGFGAATGGLFGSRALRSIADAPNVREPIQGNLDLPLDMTPLNEPKQGNLFEGAPDTSSRELFHSFPENMTEPTPYQPHFKKYRFNENLKQPELSGLEFIDPETGEYVLPRTDVESHPQLDATPRGPSPDADIEAKITRALEEPDIESPPSTTVAPNERIPGPLGEGESFITPGEPEIIYEKNIPDAATRAKLIAEGFKPAVLRGVKILQRLATESKGEFDPQEMWNNLKRLFGREPTEEEVQTALSRQVRPGEQTGRVAPFEPRSNYERMARGTEDPTELKNLYMHLRGVSARALQEGDRATVNHIEDVMELILRKIPDPMEGPRNTALENLQREVNPDDPFGPRPEVPPEDKWDQGPAPEPRMELGQLPEPQITDVAPYETIRPAVEGVDQPAPPQMGQQELSMGPQELMEPQIMDGDAISRIRAEAMDRLAAPPESMPEQLSLGPQMQDAEIQQRLAQEGTIPGRSWSDELGRFITDETGAVSVPTMEDLRAVGQKIKRKTGLGMGGNMPPRKEGEINWFKEAVNLPTNLTTTLDYSAPGRQGLPLIFTTDFLKAFVKMFPGGWSPEHFDAIDAEIRDKPIFRSRRDAQGNRLPSRAQEAGMELMAPGHKAGPREEATASKWIETGAFLGGEKVFGVKNPLALMWKHTIGRPIRGSNRAYNTFLNVLRANRFERLMNESHAMSVEAQTTGKAPMQGLLGGEELFGTRIGLRRKYTMEEARAMNPYENTVLAKEIADFVNTATGRGPLRFHYGGKREANLEGAAGILAHTLFSPRNTASKLRMMNPLTYTMATPYVRKQYLKAALGTATAWYTFAQLAKLGDPTAEVNDENITSADFGKIRIGDFRMDPAGGFQQNLVAFYRLWNGGMTSSASNRWRQFGKGFQAETPGSMGERMFANKLNPVTKYAWDIAFASEYNPMHMGDRTMQLFVPLIAQDLTELYAEDPKLWPWMAPIVFGWGSQIYSKGESVSKFMDPENDIIFKGGALRNMFNPLEEEWALRNATPWNWNE